MVEPADSDGVLWRFSERDAFLAQDGLVHLAFVSRRDGRVKGVEQLQLGSTTAALERATVLLDHLSDGDWVILVAGGVTQDTWLQVQQFLNGQQIDDGDLAQGAASLAAVWRKGDIPLDKTLVLNPSQSLRVPLGTFTVDLSGLSNYDVAPDGRLVMVRPVRGDGWPRSAW